MNRAGWLGRGGSNSSRFNRCQSGKRRFLAHYWGGLPSSRFSLGSCGPRNLKQRGFRGFWPRGAPQGRAGSCPAVEGQPSKWRSLNDQIVTGITLADTVHEHSLLICGELPVGQRSAEKQQALIKWRLVWWRKKNVMPRFDWGGVGSLVHRDNFAPIPTEVGKCMLKVDHNCPKLGKVTDRPKWKIIFGFSRAEQRLQHIM